MADFSISRKLFDHTFGFLERALDMRTLNHRVLSSNIANAETPDYRAQVVPFQKLLDRSGSALPNLGINRTHSNHIPENMEAGSDIEITDESVNLDREMAKLAENNLMFNAGVQTLIKKLEALKFTILDVGR